MKLNIINGNGSQADPYVISENGRYYMYATHSEGVQLYVSDNMNDWEYKGFCYRSEREKEYWAPAVTKINGKFYLYYSSMPVGCDDPHKEQLRVAVCDTADGNFEYLKTIAVPFSIDPHVVISGEQLYIFYSINDYQAERAGTYIVVDKMLSPTELANQPKAVIRPTSDREIFMKDRFFKGQHWHTVEGAFYLRNGDYHYVMYSGNCYQNEDYFVGYAVAHGNTDDLLALDFVKVEKPLLEKNAFEEGTGHNSVLEVGGKHYMFYHARDLVTVNDGRTEDRRTARVCELTAENGMLKS